MKKSIFAFLSILMILITMLYAESPTKENVTKLYVATFNRAPDSVGLNYWLNDSGLILEQIAQSFFDQAETKALYPASISNRAFIKAVYSNLFNRDPDTGGWEYWEGELNSGHVPKSVFILAVINGAQGDDVVILENKREVGNYYTENGLNNLELAKEVMKNVDVSSESVAAAIAMIDLFIETGEINGGVKIDFPSLEKIDGVSIQETITPPALPGDNFSLDGKIYDINIPDSAPLPAKVSLPASEELLNEVNDKQIVIGRYNGESWDIIPATIIDKSVVAEVDHFSSFAAFWRSVGDISAFSKEELESFTVKAPSFDWLKVENNEIIAVLNLENSRFADGATVRIIPLVVDKWELCVLKPDTAFGIPISNRGTCEPLLVNGEAYMQAPFVRNLIAKVDVNLTNLFDFSTIMHKLNRDSNPENYGSFAFKIRPIFNDVNHTKGAFSEYEYLPVAVADTHIRLIKGLSSRLDPNQKEEFIRRVFSNPYLLPYKKGWPEAYGTPLSLRNRIYLGARGIFQPLIGIKGDSEWVRVVTHEWGHYASHMLLGDDWTKNAAAADHEGWKEASLRTLAWSEDLATFLGQWGLKEIGSDSASITLPLVVGAMGGDISDYSIMKEYNDMAEGKTLNDYWPINKNMDAIEVESVSASILSRLSLEYSLSEVMKVILSSKATTLVEFIKEWFDKYGMNSSESLFLQNLCIDEGVRWIIYGKVVNDEGLPLKEVSVTIEGMGGALSSSLAKGISNNDGDFNITIPPGDVKMKFERSGYKSLDNRDITANMVIGTNLGYADDSLKLFIGRSGEVGLFSGGTGNWFRMNIVCGADEEPVDGECKNIFEGRGCPLNLDPEITNCCTFINIQDKDGDGYYEDRIFCRHYTRGSIYAGKLDLETGS